MTLYATGFDDAIIGRGERFHDTFVVYDLDKLLGILMERDGMTEEEAREFYEFNIVGAWVGEKTPAFVTLGLIRPPEADGVPIEAWMAADATWDTEEG